MDRRGFLRFLGLGAAGAVAAPIIKPKAFFSFFGTGEVWRPATATVRLEASADTINWVGVSGIDMLDAVPLVGYQHTPTIRPGFIDQLMILDKTTWIDLGALTGERRYIRLAEGSPDAVLVPAKPNFLLAT